MRTRILGIVLIIVSLGVDVWLATALASGTKATGVSLGFVVVSLPFLAAGIYFLLMSHGEVKEESKVDKERNILDSVMTRGRVGVADLAIENNLSRDKVKALVADLIGKDLFRGYVNWERGELVSAEAAQMKDGVCPNCGGKLELAGKGLVRCPYCGTEIYLSAASEDGSAKERQASAPASGPPPPASPPTPAATIAGDPAAGGPASGGPGGGAAPLGAPEVTSPGTDS
jgi:DNA-directed RNA polymerase subunit RPC12/RpoP